MRKINFKELTRSKILEGAFTASKELGLPMFLVGGAIRDLLLSSRLGRDFDLAIEGDVRKTAKLFAEKIGGTFFCLDQERRHYRVTVKEKGRIVNIDLSPLRGQGIEEDLRERDFTINSMAIDLEDLFEKEEVNIIDPVGGASDMEEGIIRVSSSKVFDDDPLRLLRAVRIAAATNFSMEDSTEELIKDKKALLIHSSWERIRDELFLILSAPLSSESIEKLDNLGLLAMVIPEVDSWKDFDQGEHHDHSLFYHALRSVGFVEAILSNFSHYFPDHTAFLTAHFREELESNITRHNLLKLTAFLHDSGKVETRSHDGERVRFFGHERVGEKINKTMAGKLKLGRKASRIITNLTRNHMRILNLSKSSNVSRRAKYRFFRDLDGDGLDCLMLSLADGLATKTHSGPQPTIPLVDVIEDVLKYYFEEWLKTPGRPLLNGKEIMELLGIPSGREVGRLLSALEEAEAEEVISTREEAKDFVESMHGSLPVLC